MSYNVKNYTEQGGEKTVIGGTLEVSDGATVTIGGTLEVSDGATVTGITGVAGTATATALGGIKASAKGAGDTVEVKIDGTTAKLYVPTYPKSANVALAAGEAPTKAEFDALITALIAAGIMESAE